MKTSSIRLELLMNGNDTDMLNILVPLSWCSRLHWLFPFKWTTESGPVEVHKNGQVHYQPYKPASIIRFELKLTDDGVDLRPLDG
jgi:hypothetical protein